MANEQDPQKASIDRRRLLQAGLAAAFAGPVGALAYWAADAIRNKYLKNPGPLVDA